jgi:hypothetical protein
MSAVPCFSRMLASPGWTSNCMPLSLAVLTICSSSLAVSLLIHSSPHWEQIAARTLRTCEPRPRRCKVGGKGGRSRGFSAAAQGTDFRFHAHHFFFVLLSGSNMSGDGSYAVIMNAFMLCSSRAATTCSGFVRNGRLGFGQVQKFAQADQEQLVVRPFRPTRARPIFDERLRSLPLRTCAGA